MGKKLFWIILFGIIFILTVSGTYLILDKDSTFLKSESKQINFIESGLSYVLGNGTIPYLTIQTKEAEWIVTKHTGEEIGLSFWTANAKDKKTELGWIPLDNSCSGWDDKYLYNQSGSMILDDQDKEIKLKCESSKCDGLNCYYISLTNAKAINIDEYVQLGNNTIVTEYQNISLINYNSDWFSVNVTLFMNMSGNWDSTANDVWVRHDPDKEKFGANVSKTEDTFFKYEILSDNVIKPNRGNIYYISKTTPGWCGSVRCNNEQFHNFDFSDICNQRYNNTIINVTSGEKDGGLLFDPQCSFNLTNDYDENNTFLLSNLEVTFYGEYNATAGMIFVDPQITITDVSVAASILTNITAENNFTHLTIGDADIGFINDTNLVLYMPFDTNTSSTTTYDYSSNNIDGTFFGQTHYVTEGVIGGATFYDGVNDYTEFTTTPLNDTYTISLWATTDTTGTDYYMDIENCNTDATGYICIVSVSGTLFFRTYYTAQEDTSGGTIAIGDWTHIGATYDKGNKTIYVNGIAVGNDIITHVESAFTDGRLGLRGDDQNDYTGRIDEVMILDVPLTATQMLAIYNNQSSRFFPVGNQEFVNNNVTNGTFINVTINSSTFFGSSINVTLGNLTGSSYDFGDEFAFTNNFVSDIPVGTPQNFSLKFIFYAGNTSDNSFYSPTLENNILIESFGEAGAPPPSEDTEAPVVNLIAPTNGTTTTNEIVSFNVTATDNVNVTILAFYLWNSTQILINQTNTSTSGTSVSVNLSVTLPYPDTFEWNYLAFDNATTPNSAFNNTNFTLIFSLGDTDAPNVTINFPVNTTYGADDLPLNFNVTLSELGSVQYSLDGGINNVTMFNITGAGVIGIQLNATNGSIADGSYLFQVYANDTSGNNNYSESVSFSLDQTFPLITYTTGTPADGSNQTATAIFVNVTVIEINEDTITFLLYNSTTQVNSTSFTDNTRHINFTGLADETYTFNVTINDTAGNLNETTTRTVIIDTTSPLIEYVTPTEIDGSIVSQNFIEINITSSDVGVELNTILIRLYNSTRVLINTSLESTSSSYINFSGLNDGIYYFNATANDTLNNINNSVTRNVTLDTTPPEVTINFPENITYNSTDLPLNFNVTLNEAGWVQYSLNGWINITMFNSSALEFNATNSSLAEGGYLFSVYANDTLGNNNYSESISFSFIVIDDEFPLFSDFFDNNATLVGSGIALFNTTVINTNGTVFLEIDGTNYSAHNITNNIYNVSVSMALEGTFDYYWGSWGNGTKANYNITSLRNYVVNVSLDTTPPIVSNFIAYAVNSSQAIIGNETFFNTGNLTDIEFMRINFTLTDDINLSGDIVLRFTADGGGACALGNKQESICYNFTNPEATKWIVFKNGTETSTFMDEGSQGDFISCSNVGTSLQRNYTCLIDEHYNPNVMKHYNASYNFSDVKWQDGTNQRIRGTRQIRIHMSHPNIPLNADQYKLDIRINVTGTPTQPLEAWACNSTYTTGNPETTSSCTLIAQKLPSELQGGTKFRGIFTKNLVDSLGDFGFIVLKTDQVAGNNYYAIKTYKALKSPYETHWEFSINNGGTWDNLEDGYESELNINWFVDGGSPTKIVFMIESSDSAGNIGNSSTLNMTWNIDPAQNYAPLINLMRPAQGETIQGTTFNITWMVFEPNDDNFTTNLTLGDGTIIASNLNNQTFNFTWDTTAVLDGFHNLSAIVCEVGTSPVLCSNDTHQFIVENTVPPSVTSLTESPSDPATYSLGQLYEFNATVTDRIAVGTVILSFNGTNFTAFNKTADVYNVTIPNLAVGTYNYTWYANDTSGNINNSEAGEYTINRAASVVNLTLNGTQSDITISNGTTINLNGTLITGEGILNLFNNGTIINTGSSPLGNTTLFNDAGVFNVTLMHPQTQNYTTGVETWFVTVEIPSVLGANLLQVWRNSSSKINVSSVDNDGNWFMFGSLNVNKTGFFNMLGQLTNRIKQIFAIEVDTINITAVNYHSSGSVGISTILNTSTCNQTFQSGILVNFSGCA